MQKITVFCPRCEVRYQVEEDLRGKRMRCPNQLCRAVIEVPATDDQPAAAGSPPVPVKPPAPVVSGMVTDMVPILPAQLAEPAPPPVVKRPPKPVPKDAPAKNPVEPPAPVPAPPVVAPPVRVTPAPRLPAPPIDFPDDFPGDDVADGVPAPGEVPREMGPGTWEAPPVRGVEAETSPAIATLEPPPAAPPPAPGHTTRRRTLLVIAAMAVVCAGVIGFGLWRLENTRAGSEADRFTRALELYDQREFEKTSEMLQKLARDFPTSRDIRKYRFLAELSSVRADADNARELAELQPALEHVLQFLGYNQQETLLKDRHTDVWKTLHELSNRLTAEADKGHDSDALRLAQQAWTEAKKLQPPPGINVPEEERIFAEKFAGVTKGIAVHTQRLGVIAAIKDRIAQATAVGVQQARALAAAAKLDDPEVKGLLLDLLPAHRAAVKYEPASLSAATDPIEEDTLPGLLVTPALVKATAGPSRGSVVLALARGVLYALDPACGDLRWARRVGIDTSVLPLHVPADPITPELLLVVSSDSKSITAVVAATGAVAWQHSLAAPCKGQPVLVGRTLLVPTVTGRVDELEISGGRLLGHYELGQRLSVGGARQPGTSLVYFPGDEFCVYVLDVAKQTCAALLYSNHPAGSLRGVPILLPAPETSAKDAEPGHGPPGWMLLCQAKGTAAVEVRPFALPILDPDQAPLTLKTPVHVPGLSWFAPWHDAEKLALTTDKGLLSLWGIRQKGNRDDPLLFPLLKDDFKVGSGPGRAQVVHADADDYWALIGGRLHRLTAVFRPQSGPDLVRAWQKPPMLGSPLHAAQPYREPTGRTSLVATTLGLDYPTCLCTAVDAVSGQLDWQRQLGSVALCPPVVVGGRVLLRDANGVFLFDPAQFAATDGKRWQPVNDFLVRDPLAPDERVLLLSGTNDLVQLTWSHQAAATKLRVRHIPLAGDGKTEAHDLPAPPAGTPAAGDGFVLLPLANGVAVRLDYGGKLVAGPNWRAAGVDEQAPGHIVPLGGDEFLLTDGSRGLTRVSWPGKAYQERAVAEGLSHRIIAAPAVLPARGAAPPRVCVGDASDTLTLLDGERLQELRRWPLPGKITAGPFVRGTAIVCVLDNRRLLSIDPDGDEPWEYSMVSDVVGAPVLVQGMLVAADVSGRFMAFDPKTGSPLGAGYTLRANTAPETAPVPFGPGRLLVPLNDGTLVVLPLAKLRLTRG